MCVYTPCGGGNGCPPASSGGGHEGANSRIRAAAYDRDCPNPTPDIFREAPPIGAARLDYVVGACWVDAVSKRSSRSETVPEDGIIHPQKPRSVVKPRIGTSPLWSGNYADGFF